MQTTNTTSSPAQDRVKNNWEFTEVWIHPMLSPPYILLLLCNSEDNCQVYDPAQGYKVVFSSNDYNAAKLWLLEDEYEPIEGRLLAAELV
ncbi:hypothetical protein [Nostoc sp. 'Lobaria pulmonaria (5183) cyanobiont']|uniref:hypothetical protein n=1 Tax=Nostoc sp. 'Lobaria pulmonaria (5183) cyanobiont' TaxID=1618022 RepID=UPI000CF310C5|nr:hypothetical protein [Nostoc sp. 'Lobaria pulmonaria (5183) cyanobiont']AVH74049.1 hypothetical protein NLP_5770 [Nostoc sp. 'Lobaria pulmonaria (5183) cyanobiont']